MKEKNACTAFPQANEKRDDGNGRDWDDEETSDGQRHTEVRLLCFCFFRRCFVSLGADQRRRRRWWWDLKNCRLLDIATRCFGGGGGDRSLRPLNRSRWRRLLGRICHRRRWRTDEIKQSIHCSMDSSPVGVQCTLDYYVPRVSVLCLPFSGF